MPKPKSNTHKRHIHTIRLQDTITDECREAYNSLVEKPSSSLHRFNYEIANLKNTLQFSSSTSALATSKTSLMATQPDSDTMPVKAKPLDSLPQTKLLSIVNTTELKVPNAPAPRPNTLPGRNANANKLNRDPSDSDTNPLHILRDKNYRIIRPRMKINSIGMEPMTALDGSTTNEANSNQDEACESPSYLTNTQYTFSERDVNIHHSDTQKFIGNKEIENLNPIPLPPRDRNKVLLTNVKRHVRKHPLIIPAFGLQRTLNKVTTPVEEKGPMIGDHDEVDATDKSSSTANKINYNMTRTSTKPAEVMKLQPLPGSVDHFYINQTDINIVSKDDDQKSYSKKFIENNFSSDQCRTYENLDALRMQVDSTDSASLHFESILESDINPVDDVNSGESSNQGLIFDIKSESPQCSLFNRQSRTRNGADKLEFPQKFANHMQPRNELNDNALFNKFRNAVDVSSTSTSHNGDSDRSSQRRLTVDFDNPSTTCDEQNDELSEGKLKDSNSVSCEDLLEFADKKPKGKERGIESDEVRIMTKVLGPIVSTLFFTLNLYLIARLNEAHMFI